MPEPRSAPGFWTRARVRMFRALCPQRFFSFPKSGRNWTTRVLERYFEDVGGIPRGGLDLGTWTPFLALGRWKRAPGIVFSHGIYQHARTEEIRRFIRRQRPARVLFQVRDPRDVFLTYYFQRVRRPRGEPAVDMDLAEFLRDERHGIRRIVEYMNLWYDFREQFRDFHLLRYEDMREQPLARFSEIVRFLRRPVNEHALRAAVEAVTDTTREVELGGFAMLERIRRGEPEVPVPARDLGGSQYPRCSEVLPAADLEYLEEQASGLRPALGYGGRTGS